MPDRTKQVVESLLKAPALAELLKRDPAQLLTTLANCEQGQAAIKSGVRLMGDILNRFTNAAPNRENASTMELASEFDATTPGTLRTHEIPPQNGSSSSVAILGVTSLAALAGSLALLGTVSIVAINRRDD